MRQDNLLCWRHKSFVVTTDSRHSLPLYPNLAREITPSAVNQLWVADITYLRLRRRSGCVPAWPYAPLNYFQSGSHQPRRAILLQRTATTPLTDCLTVGVHFTPDTDYHLQHKRRRFGINRNRLLPISHHVHMSITGPYSTRRSFSDSDSESTCPIRKSKKGRLANSTTPGRLFIEEDLSEQGAHLGRNRCRWAGQSGVAQREPI